MWGMVPRLCSDRFILILILSLSKDEEDSHGREVLLYRRPGDAPRALASYAEALRLKPDFSVGHENFGSLLLKLGRRAEAIAHFETALRLQPTFPDAHMNLGNALVAEGRAVDAVRQWKFEPPTRRGRPALVHVRQLFRFSAPATPPR